MHLCMREDVLSGIASAAIALQAQGNESADPISESFARFALQSISCNDEGRYNERLRERESQSLDAEDCARERFSFPVLDSISVRSDICSCSCCRCPFPDAHFTVSLKQASANASSSLGVLGRVISISRFAILHRLQQFQRRLRLPSAIHSLPLTTSRCLAPRVPVRERASLFVCASRFFLPLLSSSLLLLPLLLLPLLYLRCRGERMIACARQALLSRQANSVSIAASLTDTGYSQLKSLPMANHRHAHAHTRTHAESPMPS